MDIQRLSRAIREACLGAAASAYEDAGLRGLCPEGRWEAAVGALRSVDPERLLESSGVEPASVVPAPSGSRTLGVSIARPAREVYDFVSDPRNLPTWAAGLCRSIRETDAGWIAETPRGPVGVRFAERNDLGVLDHFVGASPGDEVYVPMRVLPSGPGSELFFTLLRSPETSDDEFAADAGMVERDLATLKRRLEG